MHLEVGDLLGDGDVHDEDGGVLGADVQGGHLVERDLLGILVGGADLEVGLGVVFPGGGEEDDHVLKQDVRK